MKIGTIGTGFITDWVMGQLLEIEGIEYGAVYSRKLESAQALKEKYQVKKVYTDLNEMLNDEELDCIYVASPNSLHYEHAKKAMLAGKDVLLEKPFCSNVKECEDLIAISKKTGRILFEAITTVYNPNFIAIQNNLEKIKPIRIVECNMSQYSRKYDAFLEGNTPNVFTTQYSGGALMDINIYNLHYVVGLFGLPRDVYYMANIKEGIDTSGVLVLEYDGFKGVCIGSKDNIGLNFTQIQGEKGMIQSLSASSMTKNVTMTLRNKETTEINDQRDGDCHYYYGLVFKKLVDQRDMETCMKYLNHSLKVIQVMEKARKSAGIVFAADH